MCVLVFLRDVSIDFNKAFYKFTITKKKIK